VIPKNKLVTKYGIIVYAMKKTSES